mmetsp:Transcript_27188/g.73428  ORF Transcript_27188/g.73428 Transcript_27188/m.73428 type:complete len:591 (-) Transcript_27188:70-1842(-)
MTSRVIVAAIALCGPTAVAWAPVTGGSAKVASRHPWHAPSRASSRPMTAALDTDSEYEYNYDYADTYGEASSDPNVAAVDAADRISKLLDSGSATTKRGGGGSAGARALERSDEEEIAAILEELPVLGEKGRFNAATRRYKKLMSLGGVADGPAYTGILTACAKGKIPQIAEKVVKDMVEMPPADGLKLSDFKLALRACARGARPEEAQEVLQHMEKAGVTPDTDCFEMAMRSCIRAPTGQEKAIESGARNIMYKMRQSGIEPDYNLYGALLQVLVRARRYKEALASFELLCIAGAPSVSHYQNAMTAAVRVKDIDTIKSLLSEMNLEGTIHADTAQMLIDATKAVADAGEWRLACSLLARLPEPRPVKTYHAVIASCSRAKNSKTTVQLFDQMRAEGLEPKRQTYNAVLHSTQSVGDFESANKVLSLMSENGITLNTVTYNIAISTRARIGDYRGAINLLAEMEIAGLEPSVVSYATAINAAAKGNSSTAATMLVKEMGPRWGLVPNQYVFTAAISACENDPDDTTAAKSAQQIVDVMAEVGIEDEEVKQRLGKQVTEQLHRDRAVMDNAHLKADEEKLGVGLGRQLEV